MFDNLSYRGGKPGYPEKIFDNDLGKVIVERRYTLDELRNLDKRGEGWDALGEFGMRVVGKFGSRIFAKDVSLREAAAYKRRIDADHKKGVAKMAKRYRHTGQRKPRHTIAA